MVVRHGTQCRRLQVRRGGKTHLPINRVSVDSLDRPCNQLSNIFLQSRNLSPFFSLSYQPWAKHTATELVWGYEEPMFALARLALPNPPSTDKFGYFTDVSC